MTEVRGEQAALWSSPDGPLPDPPVATKPAVLPIDQLTWEDTERLFARVLETEPDIDRATLFGVPGQAQAGIDVYGRLTPAVGTDLVAAARFVALQSRRIRKVTPAQIAKSVEDFLAGEWADRSARFYYATSSSLRDTKLNAAIRDAADQLTAREIEFVPWGLEEVSERLRDHPRIVDDFFDRAWAVEFCGKERVAELSRRLTGAQARHLRSALGNLYRGAFHAHGASAMITATANLPYLVLDTVPVAAEPDHLIESDRDTVPNFVEDGAVQDEFASYSFMRRRSTRPRRIAPAARAGAAMTSRTRADEWMGASRLRLLIGAPGSGKSSFLMFATTDLLSDNPQSVVLQRAHAGALPLWLPFAFLCRHLEESTSNSVVTAIRAWITYQGREEVWSIIEPALHDDRVVLLVDGVDEWNDLTKADQALGLLESFVTQRNISATLSARPYALTRLGWRVTWSKAMLAPLSFKQKLQLTHGALTEADLEATGTVRSAPAAQAFLAELDRIPALEPLTDTPLFLSVLAKSWRGEALSPQRHRLFSDLVRLLIERHPQMRKRASSASGSDFPVAQMQTVLRGVAYRARLETSSVLTTRLQMELWFRDELASSEGLGYPLPKAGRIAHAVLSQAEDEYGLIVPQGTGMVGFLHRVLLDQLAGEHLASLPFDDVAACFRARLADPNWRDVLIAALSEQPSSHVNAAVLEQLGTDATIDDVDRWELVATAIAADVALTSVSHAAWVDEIVTRVDTHHDATHRAELTRSLVGMTRHPALHDRLLPTFSRWLAAAHPEPISAIWALRNAPVDNDDALTTLMWGLRHTDDGVKLNAAHAIAIRFAGNLTVKSAILAQIRAGATATAQAFTLLSLGAGWPDAPELPGFAQWARAQPTLELRICGLHLAAGAHDGKLFELTRDEQHWLQGFLRQEQLPPDGSWMHLARPFIERAVKDQPYVPAYILETLANNGRNGGNRDLAWHLACTTFSDSNSIREWVASQLGDPEKKGLILYDVSLIPDTWRYDPEFARQTAVTVKRDAATSPYIAGVIDLSASLTEEEALDALLPALDSFHPFLVASALLERFGEDPRVLGPITDRLNGEYGAAAKFAGVAITALGEVAGFNRLVELLRTDTTRPNEEDRVLIATAVADAWSALLLDRDNLTATEILSRYDEDELARRCTAVGTRILTWHVGSVIGAWPHHPSVVEFACEALRHPRSLTRGVMDPTPAAILRAYAPLAEPAARDMVNAVLDQLAYLPGDTREVLTAALTDSDLPLAKLLHLFRDWHYEPDIWVQRAALTGLVRRYDRYRLSADADPAQVDSVGAGLRDQIRTQLVTYGPDYEDRRQSAWVAMLLLREPHLHDSLRESLSDPSPPGVRLTHMLGGVDVEFVDLLNANWESLAEHFGEEDLFLLLSGARAKEKDDDGVRAARHQVLLELTRAPATHPRIRDLTAAAAETDPGFRNNPGFLAWAHRGGRSDAALFEACLNALHPRRFDEEPDGLYEILLDATAWDLADDAARELIRRQQTFERSEMLRALYAERFPTDPLTRSWYDDLEAWFRIDGPRGRRQWQDTLAVAVRASPADALPTIVERAHEQIRRQELPELLSNLTAPLLRRLRNEPDAVTQMRTAMHSPLAVRADTSIWKPEETEPATAEDAARRTYLHARLLQRAGKLDPLAAVEVRTILLKSSGDVVAHDPFLNVEGSLQTLMGVLTRQRA